MITKRAMETVIKFMFANNDAINSYFRARCYDEYFEGMGDLIPICAGHRRVRLVYKNI